MDRPLRLAKWYADNQISRPERRGGSRNDDKWKERNLLISEHIQSFTCRASQVASALSHCLRFPLRGRINQSE